MTARCSLKSVRIAGYRAFRDFQATLGPLEILVGANGSGKSSLFEFLKFLRDSLHQEIPPEIIAGSIGQRVFRDPELPSFSWDLEIDIGRTVPIRYEGELVGVLGETGVTLERVESPEPLEPDEAPFVMMEIKNGRGYVYNPILKEQEPTKQEVALIRRNQLALGTITNPLLAVLCELREFMRSWRFYSSSKISNAKIRRPVLIEQNPVLHEDAGNLSSVLHYLMTECRTSFDELENQLRSAIPGFKGLTVKALGGPGEVMAFWQERGVDQQLTLADVSDGILRFLCWACLCVQPNPPSLICIDEPDGGVHPRTLPILAALFEKALERTQILLATHGSYFLTQFDISRIAVMRKEDGEAQFIKPTDSAVLMANLEDFGAEEIEAMHRSDELERLA
ncbi:MAG: AAA family ATPase [bacterium]